MTEQMTEAARLYWKDMDVLEQARREFADYLELIQKAWWKRVQQWWQENPSTVGQRALALGAAQKDPGHWWVNYAGGTPTGLGIDIRDPRRAETAQLLTVRITLSNEALRRLKARGQDPLKEASEAARSMGVDISWADPCLSIERVELNPDDAMDTADRLAQQIYRYLKAYVVMEEKLGSPTTSK